MRAGAVNLLGVTINSSIRLSNTDNSAFIIKFVV